jgi:4-alpha-glucanotransferase
VSGIPQFLSRRRGVLLPIFSLPGSFGMGELGPCSHRWLDFLADRGQGLWQILPMHPPGPGHSPYQARSALAGDPLLVGLEGLLADGLLLREECANFPPTPVDRVDHCTALPLRRELVRRAARRFLDAGGDAEFADFCKAEGHWLEDYALFDLLGELHAEGAWTGWPPPLRDRHPEALAAVREKFAAEIALRRVEQYFFQRQWKEMHRRAAERDIKIFGDMPIFLALHSADVWAERTLFDLLPDGSPRVIAGVPPDYFSATGQRWGNPLYLWQRHGETGYAWWRRRLERATALHDAIRLDHFRGFAAHWEIPESEPTAVHGRWVAGPGEDFFRAVEKDLGPLPLVAEDLGLLDPAVWELRDRLGLPGLRIFLFALDDMHPNSPFLPTNFCENCVAYTGTHDNDTLHGALFEEGEVSSQRRQLLASLLPPAYHRLGRENGTLAWLADSPARWVLFPLQDLLHGGASTRTNRPGTVDGNWAWRASEEQLAGLDRSFLLRLGKA